MTGLWPKTRTSQTFIKRVLVLLGLAATASHVVQLAHEATAAGGLGFLALGALPFPFVVTGKLVDEVHL